jgi:hypothetical protein
MKKISGILIIFTVFQFVSAAPFFSGYTGIRTNLYSNSDSSTVDPELTTEAFFAGQLDFNNFFLLRTELSIQTEDILASGLFKNTDAVFCIDELSATFHKQMFETSQYFSVFLGTYEPIGSDVFLQRQFGIQPITSKITDNWLGLNGSVVYPFYGAGCSYVIHFDRIPVASGLYLYENRENDNNDLETNIDFRLATVTRYVTLDIGAGIGAPLEQKDGDTDVILLIDTIYLHTGLTMLVGNAYTNSLFVQCGFQNLPVKGGTTTTEIDSSDIYLLLEPRLITKDFKANLTLFSLPQETADTLLFITDPLGINISIFNDMLYIKNTNFTFGFHATCSFPDKTFMDITDVTNLFSQGSYTVRISPFISTKIMGGQLNTMIQITATDFSKDSWSSAVKLNAGYKKRL